MALYQRLEVKLTQKLSMTPQMQLSVKLLQKNAIELKTAIFAEVNQNPFLDVQEEFGEYDPVETYDEASDKPAEMLDLSSERLVDDLGTMVQKRDKSGFDGIKNLDNISDHEETLYNHLIWSIGASTQDTWLFDHASEAIGYLDENGFFSVQFDELKSILDIEEDELKRLLIFLHELDPIGIGCFTVQESLLVQIKVLASGYWAKKAIKLLSEAFELLDQPEQVQGFLDLTEEEVGYVYDVIRMADPKPARAYSFSPTEYIEPDVVVEKNSQEELVVRLSDGFLPPVLVNDAYYEKLEKQQMDNESKDFMKEKIKEAKWFVRSLEQRKQTILKVASAVITHQREYFNIGVAGLKPLTLNDVASVVGVHASTVSRVVSTKYMLTPNGIQEMKFFFQTGLAGVRGSEHSALSVQQKIRDLIRSEPAKKPFSDEAIVKLLKKEGVSIGRRTVAKYRAEMGIPSSTERRA